MLVWAVKEGRCLLPYRGQAPWLSVYGRITQAPAFLAAYTNRAVLHHPRTTRLRTHTILAGADACSSRILWIAFNHVGEVAGNLLGRPN